MGGRGGDNLTTYELVVSHVIVGFLEGFSAVAGGLE